MGFAARHRGLLAATLAVLAVAGLVVVLAVRSHGYPSRRVDLNDGGIWVTSDSDGLFGRLNKPAAALDLALNPPGGAQSAYQLDVRQEGAAALAWDQASGRLMPVDVDDGKLIGDHSVPVSASEQVGLAGGTLAVLDPSSGKVWAMRADTATGLDSLSRVDPSAKPVATLGGGGANHGGPDSAALAVGTDGTVYAVNAGGRVATITPEAAGFAKPRYTQLRDTLRGVQVSAVGDRLVVLDAKAGRIVLPGGHDVSITPDPRARIQAPSADGRAVIVATSSALLSVPLDGAKPATLYSGADGIPAAPTWLGDCVHAAWSGQPGVYVRSCGGKPAKRGALADRAVLVHPVFRVNRGAILLNDLTTGSVFDLDTMRQVDDWSSVKPPPVHTKSKKSNNNTNTTTAHRDLPPKALADNLGARPGRTTVLHVLDNDSDPQGYILSVSSITQPSDPNVALHIAPDGQSVEITLPPQGGNAHFRYTVDDGKGLSASADVSVVRRTAGQNKNPTLRPGFTQRRFTVGAGGRLDIPVLSDWRDFDGDPVTLLGAKAGSGSVSTTPDGSIDYLAPASGGTTKITYQVSDGHGRPVEQAIPVTVLGPASTKTVAAVAEPDTAHGQTNRPIVIDPLANDLPGVDPTNPAAALAIAGHVASPAGTDVQTDLRTGQVTLTAKRKGVYLLSYTAAFGNAPFSRGSIRVDVKDPPPNPQPPVTMPDTATIYGQVATRVDVLANDFDPSGGVLVVQHAAPEGDASGLQVAVVGGRWLRIAATSPDLRPNPQLIDYTVTDGQTDPVHGEVTVTQLPPLPDDTPVPADDYTTVRGGDSVAIPVLDNDTDPSGAVLTLLGDVPGAPHPGQLSVLTTSGTATGAGSAFVSGNLVRYIAPVVRTEAQVTISYVVQNPDGHQATGTAHVTIEPPPSAASPDQAPAPQPATARVVAGDTVKINIMTTGIDPDGDTATVSGIDGAPTLGRIVSIGATSITYEAFPTSAGTDGFGFLVTDPYGKSGEAQVHIGVVPPGDPQPPVAVDDSLTASPGVTLRVNVLDNDLVAPDDDVRIAPLRASNPELPAGVRLTGPQGPIEVPVPPATGKPTVVLYSISDGVGEASIATLTVHSQAGYRAPPNAVDAVAKPKPGAATATVDVLAHDSDPTGSALRVSKVYSASAVVRGAKVTVPVLARAQNIPYVITNEHGASAAAVIHVPARGSGAPYATPDKLITMAQNGTKTIDLADYVTDPGAKMVRLTTSDELFAAPDNGLDLSAPSTTQLTLHASNDYIGPASITFQVTDGTSLDDPNGRRAMITVPVQVGPDTPVLRCPSAPIKLVEGGKSAKVDVTSLCHVWTSDPAQAATLGYTTSWAKKVNGVSISGSGGHTLTLTAGGAAKPGDTGVISIGVAGSKAVHAELNVEVLAIGPPSMRPVTIDGFTAGHTATRNLTGYVSSPLRDPHVTVVSIKQTSGMDSTARASGASVSITPGADSHGTMTYTVVVSDVADTKRTDRRTTGTIRLQVLNVPDAPGAPTAGRTVLSRVVVLSWPTPADNGAPIDHYRVSWPGGSQNCAASPCRITGLTNGKHYAFTVSAHNVVGYSKPSPALNPPATPDTRPGAVATFTTSDPQDGALTLHWSAAPDEGTPVQTYHISWSGGGTANVAGTARSVVARGLHNDDVYTFTIVAINKLGAGPPSSTTGQSAGKPAKPGGVGVAYTSAAGTTTRTVQVSWNAVDPNGPGPTYYTVTRSSGGATKVICKDTQNTSCTDTPGTGSTYTYTVTARNDAGHAGPGATTAPFVVAGTPGTVKISSVSYTRVDGQLRVKFTTPASHGAKSTIKCTASPGGGCGSWSYGAAGGTQVTKDVGGLADNTTVKITLVDCNEQQCGTPNSGSGHTSGPPKAPSVGCKQTTSGVKFTWSPPSAINGFTVSKYQTSLDGAAFKTTSSTSMTTGGQDGNSHTLRVKSVDSRGEVGAQDSATCRDPANPATIIVSMGDYTTNNCSFGCHYVKVAVKGFPANQKYTATLTGSGPNGWDPPRTFEVNTDGNGNWGPVQLDEWYGGEPSPKAGWGTVTVSMGGHTGSCYGNWQDGGSCS